MTYGWADAILMPLMGVNYYEQRDRGERAAHAGILPPVHDPRAWRTAPAASGPTATIR